MKLNFINFDTWRLGFFSISFVNFWIQFSTGKMCTDFVDTVKGLNVAKNCRRFVWSHVIDSKTILTATSVCVHLTPFIHKTKRKRIYREIASCEILVSLSKCVCILHDVITQLLRLAQAPVTIHICAKRFLSVSCRVFWTLRVCERFKFEIWLQL